MKRTETAAFVDNSSLDVSERNSMAITLDMHTVPVEGIAALHAHYMQCPRSVHAVPMQCPRSVHAPYMQIHEDACNYTHVVTRSGRDIYCV